MNETWPPTTESPYGSSEMARYKPGNFFTLRSEDHPAYDLYRALSAQGWTMNGIGSSRHWCELTNGDRFITFSLFGQGIFGNGTTYDSQGIGLEDFDDIWSNALPHIVTFMRTFSDERSKMMQQGGGVFL